ncbi:MAG: hypothetical protein U9O98_03485, partial [Asgard group archaeon]|nr:hypothetical protein [Asgard group archaeon]
KNMNANADKEIREFVENEFYLLHKRNPNNVELSVLYSKILELHILLSSSLENGCKHILTLLSRAEELVEKYPDHFEIINNFSSILVNSIQKLSQEKKIDEMINLLGTLKEYYLIFDNLDLLVQLANVYHTIIRTYGSLKKYEKQISFLKEFKEWIANDQFEIEIHIFYCKALFSTIKTLESLNKIGLSEYYLDELGEIADNFHATNNIQESYAKSLSLSIKWRLEYNANSDIIIKKFKQLYALQKEFSENDEILLAYAKAIRFMLINIDVLDLPELISTLLDNLKTLDAEYADKPVIQNEIALSYSGIILSNTLIWDDVIKDEILKEFNHLMERNPENEKLFDIYQNITPYLKKGKFS